LIEPGEILIWISVLTSAISVISFLLSVHIRSKLSRVAEYSIFAYAIALTFAFFILLRYFTMRDFNVEYVWMHSDSNLPPLYTISAVWAGREGSLLIWAWYLALFNAFFISRSKKDSLTFVSAAISSFVVLFLCILLTEFSNPFKRLPFTLPDGYGLNPLLRTVEMAIHPPTIFVGYAGMTIPFAIAVAGWIYREDWIKRARNYLIFSWIFLSIGIFLGAWWAYKTLGWGGYWAWDPVENASLLPWLTASALIHGIMVEERRKSFKNLNFFLATVTFNLIVLAAFITRSGIISSVHAFAENPTGYAYLTLIAVASILAFAVWLKRRSYGGEIKLNNLSREMLILINILILLLSTLTILIGTLTPLLNPDISLHREYYDRLEIPLGTALVVVLGICAALNWIGDRKLFFRRSRTAIICGIVAGVAVYVAFRIDIASLGVGIFVFSLLNHLQDIRLRDLANRRKIGGYIVHIGIILLFIGVMGSWLYEESYNNVGMKVGDRIALGSIELEFLDMKLYEDPEKYTIASKINVYENGKFQGVLEPKQLFYKLNRQDRVVSTVEILSQPSKDIYIAMGGMIGHFEGAHFEVYIVPLISFVWIGSILMMIGGSYTLIPRILRK